MTTPCLKPANLPDELRRVPELMRDFTAPWCVAGGWALDLYLGRVTREHADVELATFRDDQAKIQRHLHGWSLDKIVDGRRVPWRRDERLTLPVHELHARSPHQPPIALEILLNERDDDRWVFRRDARIARAIGRAILRTEAGYPVLAPEIVLLYKAKSSRAKDEADFAAVRDALDAEQRAWLARALRACHPGHGWLANLAR